MRIIERTEWGAAAVSGYGRSKWRPGMTLWVHYSSDNPDSPSFASEARQMRFYQTFHRGTRGWLDIGYHFVIGRSGRIYRGRPANTIGAHAPGGNHEPGVCLMLAPGQRPTPEQVDSLQRLAVYLQSGRMYPHSRAIATSCPGDIVRELIAAWGPGKKAAAAVKPTTSSGLPTWINTLQVILTVPGQPRKRWVGAKAWGAVAWIALNGLKPTTRAAMSYQPTGQAHRVIHPGRNTEIVNVCRSLVRLYPKGKV